MEADLGPKPEWDTIAEAVAQTTCSSSDQMPAATIRNVQDLLCACRGRCRAPDGAAKGYYPTIRFWWSNVEVEVFDDRYELYQFLGGHTDIGYFEHAPGTDVPLSLLNQLPREVQSQG